MLKLAHIIVNLVHYKLNAKRNPGFDFFLLHAPEWIICFQIIPLPCSFPINRFYTLRFDCFKNMPFSYTTWCVNLYAFNSSHKRFTKGDFSSQFIVWDIIYRTYFIYLYHSVFPILNLLKNYNHDSTALIPMYTESILQFIVRGETEFHHF